MKIRPLHDRVVIKRLEETTKPPAGLLFPIRLRKNRAKELLRPSATVCIPKTEKLFR